MKDNFGCGNGRTVATCLPPTPQPPSAVWGTKLHAAIARPFRVLGRTKLLATPLPASCSGPLLIPGPISRPQTPSWPALRHAHGKPIPAGCRAPIALAAVAGVEPAQGHFWVSPDLFHVSSMGLSHTGLINHEQDPLRIILMVMFIVSSLQEIPYPHLSVSNLPFNFQGL